MSTLPGLAKPSPYTQLFNPDFEQDTDNVGFPDGWIVKKDAEITLAREGVASGSRALVISNGYDAVSQELEIDALADKAVKFSIEARSPDSASLGVRMGHYVTDEEGKKRWRDFPVLWDKQLGTEYQTFKANFKLPEHSQDGRFWICIYRSKKEGTVVVDNLSLEFYDTTGALGSRDATILLREKEYLDKKLAEAKAIQPDNPKWDPIKAEIDEVMKQSLSAGANDTGLEPLLKTYRSLNAQILEALHPAVGFTTAWKDAFERLDPARLPATEGIAAKTTALAGEYTSFGIEVANTTQAEKDFTIELEGDYASASSEVEVRRHVLTETWYTKGATLVADPLTELPGGNGTYKLKLEPGETTRLYISFKMKGDAPDGLLKGVVNIRDEKRKEALPFVVKLIAQAPPTTPKLAHYQFLYINQNVTNRIPERASKDLEAHGVTDIEWAFKPTATFSKSGELEKIGYGAHTKWLEGFRDSKIQLNLFWQKKLLTANGEELPLYSPEWKRAWGELHRAYLDYAATLGVSRERFTVLPMDEIHSKEYKNAPDETITNYLEVASSIRSATPELPQYLTIGNYAFPEDIRTVVDSLNVAIVHWPRPEKLSRNAPPDYEARKEFFAKTQPILESARANGKLQIWSYHVQSGRSGDVLKTCLAYPIYSVLLGYTGFGYWAYNVSSGHQTWNETDDKILDYCLIYDGADVDPINAKYNVTHEEIVPSIRWKAIRNSQQDAQILLHLTEKAKAGTISDEQRKQITEITESYQKLAGEYALGTPELSHEALRKNGVKLREIYAAVAEGK